LYAIVQAHPDLDITAIVRNSDKGAKVAAQYPKIRLVYGDLDDVELLTIEASNADIVLHTAHADHVPAAHALVAGLAKKEKPGFLIHTSGTGLLSGIDYINKAFGVPSSHIFNDWDGVKEVVSLPDPCPHRNVDKIILAAGEQHPGVVYPAIVCPPTIYGPGRGPDNQKSIQVERLAKVALTRGKAIQIGEGKNFWTQIHVQDLSNVYLRLVEEAIKGGGNATWGAEAYYFAENGDFVWGDIAKAVAQKAFDKKLIKTAELDHVSAEEANDLSEYGPLLWGCNSRCRAVRARKVLGWNPVQKARLEDTIDDVVEGEAKALGLIVGHAVEAAG
jgi:hypothetical protein